jgi:hypothetical protein
VLVQAPPGNLVYRRGSVLVYESGPTAGSAGLPPVLATGALNPASLGIYLLAHVVVSSLERAAAQQALEESRPVGDSIRDLELRATTLEQLRQLLPEGGPRWIFSPQAFPEPVPVPVERNPDARHLTRGGVADPLQHLVDRAKASAEEATLFVNVLPVFAGVRGDSSVSVAATLIERSGRRLADWSTVVKGPAAPALQTPEGLRWWAEGRYRQFIVQGLRAGLVPLVEDLSDPALRAQRQQQWQALLERRFDEAGRPTDPMLEHAINAARKRSSDCALRPGQADTVVHYERTRLPNQLVAAAVCAGESGSDWSLLDVAGVAWSRALQPPPALVVRRAD